MLSVGSNAFRKNSQILNNLIPAHGLIHFPFARLKALFSLKDVSCLVAYLIFFPNELYTQVQNSLTKKNPKVSTCKYEKLISCLLLEVVTGE